ncbi:MAG: hypothetical protein AAFP86_08060 [Planctomycetota bacterium]
MSDTQLGASVPTANQGWVWDATASPKVGAASSGAFVLQDFIRTGAVDYTAGNVLVSDGTDYVSRSALLLGAAAQTGTLYAYDPLQPSRYQELAPSGTDTDVLVGGGGTNGAPQYRGLAAVMADLGLTDQHLAVADQTLTGPRFINTGTNLFTIQNPGNAAAFALDGNNRRIVLSSTSATSNTSSLTFEGNSLAFGFSAATTVTLDGSAGLTGQAFTSTGPSTRPTWDYPRVVSGNGGGEAQRIYLQAPDGNYWELKVDNAGILDTGAASIGNTLPA